MIIRIIKITEIFNLLALGQIIINHGKFKKSFLLNLLGTKIYWTRPFITKEIIQFINKIAKLDEKINIDKLKNSVNSTTFDKLQQKEKNEGFSEAIFSKKKK